ncbi:MAG: hypothetical protein UX60_C0004G0009 [Berkelbacteria bacterium GW2011_GWA2_46_7]|uniref:NYN domain-containing protein n=1 Tax=Berkelbacteria bacterium GW2011_GWA2_46_7 TaxID=1618335 RepID=A0A0G1TGB4_9BACT|nr:MAG: hypothetical protein UX60_C0004G0009 [Berkelbacteria bacterium GW2011_GWA2_46_7]
MNRLAIFIDGAYLDWVQREVFNGHTDLEKLSTELSNEKELYRTYYYSCLPYQSNPPTKDEATRFGNAQKFFYSLDKLSRFQVRLGKLAYRGKDVDGKPIFEQKGVDILLATDLVLLSAKQHISEAVVIAGDSDFIPAIEVAKAEGVLIRLYSHPSSIHQDLWNVADERCDVDRDFFKKVKR